MLEDICFSPPVEENSVACAGCIFLRPRHCFPVWTEALCFEDSSCLRALQGPGATLSGYFLKDLRPAQSQAMTAAAIDPYGMCPLGSACHKKGSKFGWSWTISVQWKHFSFCKHQLKDRDDIAAHDSQEEGTMPSQYLCILCLDFSFCQHMILQTLMYAACFERKIFYHIFLWSRQLVAVTTQ